MRFPVELTVRASRRTITLIAAIHLVAAIAFLQSSLPNAWAAAAILALATSTLAATRAEQRKARVRLLLDNGPALRLDGSSESLAPLAGSTDFGWAVWLLWRGAGRRGALMLVRDNLSDDEWRALRIWLRHKAYASSDTASGDAGPGLPAP